jgi:hypothetical protein
MVSPRVVVRMAHSVVSLMFIIDIVVRVKGCRVVRTVAARIRVTIAMITVIAFRVAKAWCT